MTGNSLIVAVTGLMSVTFQVSALIRGETTPVIQLAQSLMGAQQMAPTQGGPPPVQIVNMPESGGPVSFLIDGRIETLNAGQALGLEPGVIHLVEFDTGSDVGDLKYSLREGLYKFKVTDNGWGLFKSSDPVSSVAHLLPPGLKSPPAPSEDLAHRRRPGTTAKPAATANSPASAVPQRAGVPAPPAPGVSAAAPEPAPVNNAPEVNEPPAPEVDLKAPSSRETDPPPPPAPGL
jgi:hypothetical protein